MKFFGKTDVGMVRTNNEDSFSAEVHNEVGYFIVADGMGGHNAGEVASQMAIETIRVEMALCMPEGEGIMPVLRKAVKNASKRIYKKAQRSGGLSGMGTTVDACVIRDNKAFIAHVGDSRVYLFRENELKQITTDHSLVEEMVQNKQITPEEAKTHPMKNIITRALGEENVLVDTLELELCENDKLLLCSDGLTNMIPDEDIADLMSADMPETVAEHLIRMAKDNGGDDNITAVVVFIEKEDNA